MKDGDRRKDNEGKRKKERVIKTSIRNIEDAQRLILTDARDKVSAMDWKHFGITDQEELRKFVDGTIPVALRRAPIVSPITFLNTQQLADQAKVNSLPDTRKKPLTEDRQYWLVMNEPEIAPDEATFLRDYLWLIMPEAVAIHHHIPKESVVNHFMKINNEFRLTAYRAADYIVKKAQE